MDPEHSVLMLILAGVFILMNAFFVLSEFAIVKVRKTRLEELIKNKNSNAKLAYEITRSLDTYLSATQLGITLSSLALGWIGEPAVSRLIEGPLKEYFGLEGVVVHSASFIIAFTFITLCHVVLGELVPKSIAIAQAEKATLFVAKPLHIFWIIFSPVIKIFDWCSSVMLRILGVIRPKENEIAHSEEEIKSIVSESFKGGVIDSMESEIIKNAFDFSDTVAKEIMTPRKDMVCLNKQKSYEENLKAIAEFKYTRYPYIDGSKDVVLGMIHVRDILQKGIIPNNKIDFDSIVRKFLIVPESSSISKILVMMNKERISASLVIDEYGGTAGLLTMEDIIEELVGDINDEHDDKNLNYKKISDEIYEFSGRYEIEDIEELLDIRFDDDLEQLTIGGYVTSLFERLPMVGDKIEDINCMYEITKMEQNSVKTLKVTKKNYEDDEDN